MMQRITPFLWFDGQAEEAAAFYVAIFPNARITGISRYGEVGPGPKGSVMTVGFELDGCGFTALNGGPRPPFSQALSLMVTCETQAEVDHFWSRLSDGGTPLSCGWITDRFGLTWQVVPRVLMDLVTNSDQATSGRVMTAMMGMTKFDIAELKKAAETGA